MLGGTVPENKMMGTSGLIFFISFASSDPVVPCNMWSDIVAHTGASRRVFKGVIRRGHSDDIEAVLFQNLFPQGQI
jgi:hypothetical protein